MKQLPSPIYGGDYYHQLGCINHVRYGGNPFENCNLISSNPVYLPLFSMLQGYFARITSLDSIRTMILFSSIIAAASAVVLFYLFRNMFQDLYIASIGTLLLLPTYPIFKYTEFGYFVMMPLFVMGVYLFYKNQSYKTAILLGFLSGINTITHSSLFPVTYALLASLVVFLIMDKKFHIPQIAGSITNIKRLMPFLIIIFGIAIPITLTYWFEPIFVSKLETSPHYIDWNGPGDFTSLKLQFLFLKDQLKNMFFAYSSFAAAFSSLLFMVGLFYFAAKQKMDEKTRFIAFFALVSIVLVYHYFVTIPLFGFSFIPNYVSGMTMTPVRIMIALIGLAALSQTFCPKKARNIIYIVIILLLSSSYIFAGQSWKKDSAWYDVAVTDLNPMFASVKDYTTKSTGVNDVFLTTKESGFMLNSLTGRKLVSSRRAHNDPFEDLDPREIDMAIILYGNNDGLRKELIRKYDIKYLYWDVNWISLEYRFDDNGKVTSWFDPLIAFNDDLKTRRLSDNNVSYFIKNDFVDPSLKDEFHPTYDLIFISPENYHNFTHPWEPSLDKYLEEVWHFEDGGFTVARIFSVNTNKD